MVLVFRNIEFLFGEVLAKLHYPIFWGTPTEHNSPKRKTRYVLWPQNVVTLPSSIMVQSGFWIDKKDTTLQLRWYPWGYSVTGKGWTEQHWGTIWKKTGRRQNNISGSYATDVLKRLKVGGICPFLHRPLAYDLWFTGVPRCPQQERRISHCVNSTSVCTFFQG